MSDQQPQPPDTSSVESSSTDSSTPTAGAIALVAGGSRGLGLLIARELGQGGHRVVICARDESELLDAATWLQRAGVDVTIRVCDVTDADGVEAMVQDIETGMGPIDTLVSVAGVISVGPLEVMTRRQFAQSVDIMLWGPVNLALAVLPFMRARRSGHIGTVTSIGGVVSVPHLLPYSTAKFGAVGFSEGLTAELAGTGVTATTLIPGLLRTGSQTHALFLGKQEQEYSWFATSDSIPVLSMDAERAARLMVRAVLAGKPTLILTPMAKIGARVHGMAPATTVRLMGLAARLLPSAPADQAASSAPRVDEGAAVERRLDSRLVGILTTLATRAARRFNER